MERKKKREIALQENNKLEYEISELKTQLDHKEEQSMYPLIWFMYYSGVINNNFKSMCQKPSYFT
jgi:cell division septum initiation protein DivIVA